MIGCRLSVVGCRLLVFGIWLSGTVFQTAGSLFHVIPRLRPGLLSLRSVLASSQISGPLVSFRAINATFSHKFTYFRQFFTKK